VLLRTKECSYFILISFKLELVNLAYDWRMLIVLVMFLVLGFDDI